jgi:hypothetical protein
MPGAGKYDVREPSNAFSEILANEDRHVLGEQVLRGNGVRFQVPSTMWKTLQDVTMSPGWMGKLAKVALVLTRVGHKMITQWLLRSRNCSPGQEIRRQLRSHSCLSALWSRDGGGDLLGCQRGSRVLSAAAESGE